MNAHSSTFLELKLTKLNNSSSDSNSLENCKGSLQNQNFCEEEIIDPYQMFSDSEDQRGLELTDSTCASPDTRRINEIQQFNNNSEDENKLNLFKLLRSGLCSASADDHDFGHTDSCQSKAQVDNILEQAQRRKIVSTRLNLLTTTENRLSGSSVEIIVSPFDFKPRDRLSGKTDISSTNLSIPQERLNKKILSQISQQSNLLDEVLEEDGFYALGEPSQQSSAESAKNLVNQVGTYLGQNVSRKIMQMNLNQNHSLKGHSSCNRLTYQPCLNQKLYSPLTDSKALKEPSLDKYDQMQERIFQFFESESIVAQAVGEAIHEINQSAFKACAKFSPLKLDLTKSPLRRNRANTIQL